MKLAEKHGLGRITREQAESLLNDDLELFGAEVGKVVATDTVQGQFDAMVSLAFNIGLGAFAKSTVLRLHNANKRTSVLRPDDYRTVISGKTWTPVSAPDAFLLWIKVQGKVIDGLVDRRLAEIAVYEGAV